MGKTLSENMLSATPLTGTTYTVVPYCFLSTAVPNQLDFQGLVQWNFSYFELECNYIPVCV